MAPMNFALLDNPGWHSLNSHHRPLAIWGKIAARYQPDVLFGAAMPAYDPTGFEDLKTLVADDEVIGLIMDTVPADVSGWEILRMDRLPQMICKELRPAPGVNAVELTLDDVPDMLELIALAEPGPFLPGTIRLGNYFGIRQEGQLVAMAGQRLHLTGFCEISAVCTHPDHRGRGYAGGLTTLLAQKIAARGEVSFLHVERSNDAAARLYRKLGFRKRREVFVAILSHAG